MIAEAIFLGFLSAIGWWGANYYVITPYLPEPVFKEHKEKPVDLKEPTVDLNNQAVEIIPVKPLSPIVELKKE